MSLKKFIELEIKRILGKPYLTVAIVFFLVSTYFIQYGIGQYKHILEERDNFKKFEFNTYQQFINPSVYGDYGFRLLFEPSPMMVFFDSGVPVSPSMTAIIDGSERMKIYHSLKGQGGFAMIANAFMTLAGFVLLFGSVMVLLYGYSGSKDHEWLKFLESWKGGRIKLFLYHLIPKAIILLLFSMALAGLFLLLFLINGVAVNPWQVLFISLVAFVMLLFFLLVGLVAVTLKNRFWRWASMVIVWFSMAFLIPVVIYHWTYSRATSIQSTYKMEAANQKLFTDYEKSSKEKAGTFDQSKRGSELEKEMFIYFWEGGFKKAMRNEAAMINEMQENVSFFQNLAALFPSTFFLSINTEMSSRGFSNLAGFYEYTKQKKKDFIWYLAENYILSTKSVFPPFIKNNENIYQGKSSLPNNFGFGIVVTILWIVVLFGLYWFMFNLMLDRAQKTQRELNPEQIKKSKTNVMFTSDKGLLPQLIDKLKFQKIPFLFVPGPASLPGDNKVKNLLSFFSLGVPDTLKEIGDKYIYALDPDDKGRILSEIARSLKKDVLIFNNFLAGLSDEMINHFASVLKDIKKGRKIVYFTNSIWINTMIGDHVFKWNDEKMDF